MNKLIGLLALVMVLAVVGYMLGTVTLDTPAMGTQGQGAYTSIINKQSVQSVFSGMCGRK